MKRLLNYLSVKFWTMLSSYNGTSVLQVKPLNEINRYCTCPFLQILFNFYHLVRMIQFFCLLLITCTTIIFILIVIDHFDRYQWQILEKVWGEGGYPEPVYGRARGVSPTANGEGDSPGKHYYRFKIRIFTNKYVLLKKNICLREILKNARYRT